MSTEDRSRPFILLRIKTEGKTIADLYNELHFRTGNEFQRRCRFDEKYNWRDFRKTRYYGRYEFLLEHLDKIGIWLFDSFEYYPKNLLEAKLNRPHYINPWRLEKYLEYKQGKPKVQKNNTR